MWEIKLHNKFAAASIKAQGRTRRKAFDKAFNRAGPNFLAYGFAELGTPAQRGNEVIWLALFNDTVASMRRSCPQIYRTDSANRAITIAKVN